MAAYRMTAADRRALANIQARERQQKARRSVVSNPQTVGNSADASKSGNPILKGIGTISDIGRNVNQGAFKSVEGIIDLGAGIVGAVGGLFSDDFENDVKKFVETDWTGKYLDELGIAASLSGGIGGLIGGVAAYKLKPWENSYLKEGGMIEQVAQGVGQMLPAVAVTIATGGLGAGAAAGGTATTSGGASAVLGNAAKAVGNYAVKNAGMLTIGASAAGTSTEEAFKDGASYGAGLGYGAVSGLTEMVTERLLPGPADNVIGKGLLGGVRKRVATQGVKRVVGQVAKEALGEATEEMVSEITNPLRKSIYKGVEAFDEYGDLDFYKGVGEAGLVGGLTSMAYGGTVGKAMQGKGYNGDVDASVEAIKALEKERSELQVKSEDGRLSPEDDKRINDLIDENYKQIERVLKAKGTENMSDTIERYGLDLDFDNEGNYVKTEMAQSEDGAYYSADARGKEERINALLNEAGATAYKGDLTADEKTAWKEVLRAHNKLNELGYSGKSVVIVEKMDGDNALLNEDVIIIGKNMLTKGEHIRRLVHETTHFTEGSKEWKALTRFVFGDGKNIKQTLKAELDEVVDRDGISYGYGITDADVDAVSEYFGNHNVQLTKKQRLLIEEVIANRMGNIFSDSASIDRLCSEQPSLAKRIWERIKAIVDSFGKSSSEREEIKKLRETERLFRAALETGGQEHMANVLHSGGRYDIKLNRSLFDDEVVSTANIQGNADGAVVKSPVVSELSRVRHSANTELKAFPKQEMSASSGEGKILHIIEGLEASKIKGIDGATINGYTGRAVREFAMRNNGYTQGQISNTNEFMDEMADFMENAGIRYRFIGLQDVKNATLHYTYDSEGRIKSVVLSAMVKNGDYPVNLDLSSICKKRVAMSSLIDKLAIRGSLDNGTVSLTPENIFKINTALKDAGYETACLGCFVESKRYNALKWASTFCTKWNAVVKKINPNATYFGYGDANFSEDALTLKQAEDIENSANQYIKRTKTERIGKAIAKYKEKAAAGEPLVQGKILVVDGKELNTFTKAARGRLAKSDIISDALKDKYLNCDVSTLTIDDVEFLLETGVLPGAALTNKMAVTELVKSGESYQHFLRPSDLLTDRGISKLEALPNFHGVLYGHYGSGTPKLVQSYTPYNSEIALLPNKKGDYDLAEYLYTIAGVRMQSFSDFQIQNIYDYLQMVADLAARKLPAHAYTKEISFAKLLGMTGIKVNLSVMFDIDPTVDKEHAGLVKLNPLVHTGEYATVVLEDAQGKWVYNIGDYHTQRVYSEAYPDRDKRFLQSIGFADAVKLQTSEGYTSNCGIIGVGYSNLGIEAMLNDKRIRYIIPYHASSLPADIKTATNIELGTDYTSVQNNTKISGIVDGGGNKVKWSVKEAYKRLKSGKAVIDELNEKIRNEGWVLTTNKAQNGHGSYELYEDLQQTNDPRETAGNYIDWCCSNGTLPVFYEFASHENYYKLIYDYNVYDCVTEEYAPQEAVTNTYPTKIDGKIQAGSVIDGDFDTEHFESIIDKQMAFMNEYSRDLDSDLETLAENIEKGEYSLGGILKRGKTVSIDNLSGVSEKLRRSGAAIDTEYLSAVERGDMETAQRMVDEAAKRAGYTVKAYHGTRAKEFHVFDEKRIGENYGGYNAAGGAFDFTLTEQRAYLWGAKAAGFNDVRVVPVYLKANKTFYSYSGEVPSELASILPERASVSERREAMSGGTAFKELLKKYGVDFKKAIMSKGYDSYASSPDSDNISVYSASQIKSAEVVVYDDDGNVIPLSERFKSNHKDIRHSGTAKPLDNDGENKHHEGDIITDEILKLLAEDWEVFQAKKSAENKAKAERAKKLREQYFPGLNNGQFFAAIAKMTKDKVYSIDDANSVMGDIVSSLVYGDVKGNLRGKMAIAERIYELYNASGRRITDEAGSVIADLILEKTVIADNLKRKGVETAVSTLETVKTLHHQLDLSDIKSQIGDKFGKKNSILLIWSKKEGGISLAEAVELLKSEGIEVKSTEPIDIISEINEIYNESKSAVEKAENERFADIMSEDELNTVREDIVRKLREGYRDLGSRSALVKLENEHRAEVKKLKEKRNELMKMMALEYTRSIQEYKFKVQENNLKNRIVKSAEWFREQKNGLFFNATQYKGDTFKKSLERIGNISRNGNLSDSLSRKIFSDLRAWYSKENPILYTEGVPEEHQVYKERIANMLQSVCEGEGSYTIAQLRTIANLLDHFKTLITNYGKAYIDGKYVEIAPLVEKYIRVINEVKKIPDMRLHKLLSKYKELFNDPITLMRLADGYQDGYCTEMYEALRKALINSEVWKMNIRRRVDAFMNGHKQFQKDLSQKTVSYTAGGVTHKIPLNQALYVYMTMNREDAFAGHVVSGFEYRDKQGKYHSVAGIEADNPLPTDYTDADIEERVKHAREQLYVEFNETEKEYISIIESIFNNECKKAKSETDLKRDGFTHVLDGYYCPVAIANKGHQIDGDNMFFNYDLGNFSFNKSTVDGSKHQLKIMPLTEVFDRHVRQVALYSNVSLMADGYTRIFNLDIGGNQNVVKSVKSELKNVWDGAEQYIRELFEDIKGKPKKTSKVLQGLRSGYAVSAIGANPKVLATQFSSLLASVNVLDLDCITKGITVNGKGDVNKYCSLAELRDYDNAAAMAQANIDRTASAMGKVDKIGDVLMKPIGFMDRQVVQWLFGSCQLQIEKNGGAKLGTEENKKAAGKLLEKVILETQQNSLLTERSAAMRSDNIVWQTFTMFRSDAMKGIGRFFDAYGAAYYAKHRLDAAKKNGAGEAELKRLEAELKKAHDMEARAVGGLVMTSVYIYLIGLLFKFLYNKLDDEYEEGDIAGIAKDAFSQTFGNMIGGLPIISDIYAKVVDGYDIDNYAYSAVNDLIDSTQSLVTSITDKDASNMGKKLRNISYSAGQILGVPVRNIYNVLYGLTKRISPEAAYNWDDMLEAKSYSADLKKAIEKGDEGMISTIAGLVVDENAGFLKDTSLRNEMKALLEAGNDVLPRSVGESVAHNGEQITLTKRQKSRFSALYSVAGERAAKLVKTSLYRKADNGVKSAALKFVYDTYYNLALQEVVGEELEGKNVLFAEAMDIEQLAIIVAYARSIEADKDRSGNSIAGSKKAKIERYIQSLGISAAEKYMMMGYLGYKCTNGASAVKGYINRLPLTKAEKERLYEYCGYAA